MEKVRGGVYRLKVDRAFEVVMELQAKEPGTSDQAGVREVGKGENATIGCSVGEWMLDNFGVADYDCFGFRADRNWRGAFREEVLRTAEPQQPKPTSPAS